MKAWQYIPIAGIKTTEIGFLGLLVTFHYQLIELIQAHLFGGHSKGLHFGRYEKISTVVMVVGIVLIVVSFAIELVGKARTKPAH